MGLEKSAEIHLKKYEVQSEKWKGLRSDSVFFTGCIFHFAFNAV